MSAKSCSSISVAVSRTGSGARAGGFAAAPLIRLSILNRQSEMLRLRPLWRFFPIKDRFTPSMSPYTSVQPSASKMDISPPLHCGGGLGCDAAGCGFCRDAPDQEEMRVLDLHCGGDAARDPVLNTLNASGCLVEAKGFSQPRRSTKLLDQLGVGIGDVGVFHGQVLNAAFKQKSNGTFNNALFSARRMSDSREEQMHETMDRLYQAAEQLKQVKGQSAVGRLLNVSPQVIKNWEARGVSKQGAITAQEVVGCSAGWLMDGVGPMATGPHSLFNAEEIPLSTSVPLISWVQAGAWADVADPHAPGVADHWMPCPVRHGPNTYALRVRGESMFNPDGRPSYSDGDIIFVDPSREANHGDRVVVRLEDQAEVTFKQLLIEDGRKLLKALNPEWKPRYIEINGNATMAGVVIGKWVPE